MANVLILDSDPEIRELLARQAAHLGHNVVTEGRPDIVLAEPAYGLSLQRLEMVRHPQLRVVCVSLYPRGTETEHLGASAHLVKPVSLHELESAIGRVVADRS